MITRWLAELQSICPTLPNAAPRDQPSLANHRFHESRIMGLFRIRTLLLLGCGVALLFWLRYGEQVLRGQRLDPAEQIIAEYRREVESRHPESTNWLQQQQDHYGERALAAGIRSQRGALASFETQQQLIRNSARLISLYERDPLRDEALLWSHGTALRVAEDDSELSEELLRRLEAAQADPQLWSLVRDNPVALSSDLVMTSEPHRALYAAEQRWIDDLITALVQTVDVPPPSATQPGDDPLLQASETVGPPAIRLDTVLEVILEEHACLQAAIPEPLASPSEAAVVFLTFLEHRELLTTLCREGVPAIEAVEVLLLNADSLAANESTNPADSNAAIAATAAKLIRIQREKKLIWEQARREPLLLQFDELVPAYSERLIEKFPQHGIPALIVSQYAEAPLAAAVAIDRYGELAIAVLVHYADSPRFRELLGRGERGYQTVMVAAMESDVGLEKLVGDPRYLSKLIDDRGNPRKADWWQSVPVVGGIANVARNYASDRPSDWSEIGWAAWDVADAVLIVSSLGTSKLFTEAGKQGMKAAARGAGRQAALRAGGRSTVASSAVSTRSLTALQRIARLTSGGAGSATARASTRAAATSATLRIGGRLVALAAQPVLAVTHRVYQASRVVFTAASSVPPLVRLWVSRGLLGISLLARTPAMLRSVATGAANFTAAVADQLGQQVDAIKQLIGLPQVAEGLVGRGLYRMLYWGGFVLIALAAWMSWTPRTRPRLGWAGGSNANH